MQLYFDLRLVDESSDDVAVDKLIFHFGHSRIADWPIGEPLVVEIDKYDHKNFGTLRAFRVTEMTCKAGNKTFDSVRDIIKIVKATKCITIAFNGDKVQVGQILGKFDFGDNFVEIPRKVEINYA